MTKFSFEFKSGKRDPAATLIFPADCIRRACLSVAFRSVRNRSGLYQRKHADRAAKLYTRERDQALAALNVPVETHYEWVQSRLNKETDPTEQSVIAFAISDLTANPLRPHYDFTISESQRSFHSDATNKSVYGQAPSARLFYLEDEPIGFVPYTLLAAGKVGDLTRFSIHHNVRVNPDGSLPADADLRLGEGGCFWAACPPLLIGGEHKLDEFALRDYDLRHVFGFPKAGKEHGLYAIYDVFASWERWSFEILNKLKHFKSLPEAYHAALGLNDREVIIIHRIATIPDLAEELKLLGAKEAVLLDSGGSCMIWANWVNANRGGTLASAWNFRPARGAVIFLVIDNYVEDR